MQNARGKEVVRKSDKLIAQMILVASSRKLSMKEVLKHPIGPMPCSLARKDGAPRMTNKAALARKLESKASPADEIKSPSACIIDGMKGDKRTFEELAELMLVSVIGTGAGSERIDVVFDVYRQL